VAVVVAAMTPVAAIRTTGSSDARTIRRTASRTDEVVAEVAEAVAAVVAVVVDAMVAVTGIKPRRRSTAVTILCLASSPPPMTAITRSEAAMRLPPASPLLRRSTSRPTRSRSRLNLKRATIIKIERRHLWSKQS